MLVVSFVSDEDDIDGLERPGDDSACFSSSGAESDASTSSFGFPWRRVWCLPLQIRHFIVTFVTICLSDCSLSNYSKAELRLYYFLTCSYVFLGKCTARTPVTFTAMGTSDAGIRCHVQNFSSGIVWLGSTFKKLLLSLLKCSQVHGNANLKTLWTNLRKVN